METKEANTKDYTVKDLILFLNNEIETKHLKATTGLPLRIAVRKVMKVTSEPGEKWEIIPLDRVDLNKRLEVFKERTKNECSDATVRIYFSRFRRAIKLFEESEIRKKEIINIVAERMRDSTSLQKILNTDEINQQYEDAIKKLIDNIKSLFSDYTFSYKYKLESKLKEKDFENQNIIYPVFLESNNEAYFIIPNSLSESDKEKITQRLKTALDLTKKEEL